MVVALNFLHSNGYSHNNLSIDAIFVSRRDNYSWKIGCLEFLTKPGAESVDILSRLKKYKQKYSETNCLPPEDLLESTIKKIDTVADGHRRDSYAYGLLASEMLASDSADQDIPVNFLNCKASDIKVRLKFDQLLADKIFANCDYLKIKKSLIAFASLSETDKSQFIDDLVPTLRAIDEQLLAAAILPLIMTSRVFMLHPLVRDKIAPYIFVADKTGHSKVDHCLITIELFQRHVVPVIIKLYLVKNLQLRLILLEYLPFYVHLINKDELTVKMLPAIQLGLKGSL